MSHTIENNSELVINPELWAPDPDVIQRLIANRDNGVYGDFDVVDSIFDRLTLGIATRSDRRFLRVIGFLNSMPK